MTLDQLNTTARDHCKTCEHATATTAGTVDCAIAPKWQDSLGGWRGGRLAFVNGTCPRGLWDHSTPIKHEPKPQSGYVYICAARYLDFPVKAWEWIQQSPLVGTKYRVPRAVWDEVKGLDYNAN